jgi:hypothetical protein
VSVRDLPPEEVIALALEAISDRAPGRLRPLLRPGARIVTGRAAHEGVEAALQWASKGYEHLDRRYVVVRTEPFGDGHLVRARVEYVWRESGEVGDSTPTFIAVKLEDGLVAGLSLHDSEERARAALGG